MTALAVVFWASLGALVWTHAGYPIVWMALSRLVGRPVRAGELLPTVTVIIAAHNEETVIERRISNLRALDYPAEKLKIGPPKEPGVTLGPLISKEHQKTVLSYYQLAVEEGATIVRVGRALFGARPTASDEQGAAPA